MAKSLQHCGNTVLIITLMYTSCQKTKSELKGFPVCALCSSKARAYVCVCMRCEHPCMCLHCIINLYLIFTTIDNQTLVWRAVYCNKGSFGQRRRGAAATVDRFSAL